MTSAPVLVEAEIAASGVMPESTSAEISLQADSVWKFTGEPESVPMAMTAPPSMN